MDLGRAGCPRPPGCGRLDERGCRFITERVGHLNLWRQQRVSARGRGGAHVPPGGAEACVVSIDAAAILAQCEGRLARYKRPARVVTWDALPKSGYGKVVKADVKRPPAEQTIAP